jgi:hypothetical protein
LPKTEKDAKMDSNSVSILQQNVITSFDNLMEMVTSEQAGRCSADEMERRLLAEVLKMGAGFMQLFLDYRSQQHQRKEVVAEEGERLPYHGERERRYFSIFGELSCRRPYFYRRGHGGESPLDANLGLGEGCYSDLLREFHEEMTVFVTYEKVWRLLQRLLGIELSSRVMQEFVISDATEVEAYYEQRSAPPVEEEAPILVAQADGKGVPMVRPSQTAKKVRLRRGEARSRKKTAVVTSLYTIQEAPRTAEQVVQSLHRRQEEAPDAPQPPKREGPQHKQLWATLAGKDPALARLAEQVAKRDGEHIQHRVALCDGDPHLQSKLLAALPGFTLVLDFIHAYEYLWKPARLLFGEGSEEALSWVTAQTQLLLSGRLPALIDLLQQTAEADGCKPACRKQCLKVVGYFQKNQEYMDYAAYLQRGWPIASGVIEAACRHLVKDRMELSGMRWSEVGAEQLLRLRAVAENGHWDDYHLFRKQRRQQRLYGCDWPANALHWNFQLVPVQHHPSPKESTIAIDNVEPEPVENLNYHSLPLAA